MSSNPPQPTEELSRLLIRLTDGQLRDDEILRLRELLRSDPEALRAYARYTSMNAMLAWRFASQGRAAGDSGAPLDPTPGDLAEPKPAAAGQAASMQSQQALHGFHFADSTDADDEPESLPSPPIWNPPTPSPRSWRIGWISGIAAAVVIAAVITFSLLKNDTPPGKPLAGRPLIPATTLPEPVRGSDTATQPAPLPPPLPPIVANLTGSVDAAWQSDETAPLANGDIPLGRQLVLSKGFAELHFKGGAIVVIEAPARVTIDSETTMSLAGGRIAPTAAGKAAGFTVRTPLADVIDLGTQFGVEVAPAGRTTVHVFEGRVMAAMKRPASDNGAGPATTATTSPILTKGDAGLLSATGVTITPGAASPQTFVRALTTPAKQLDVVDLICGGDGTTRRRGLGIDRRDGTVGSPAPVEHVTEGAFRRVTNMPAVDGVFFPTPEGGATKVDSAGHQFAFPPGVGRTFNHIWTGGQIPWPEKKAFITTIGKTDYAAEDHRVLVLHASNGLTLDLEQIRRLHPQRRITGFRAVYGNTVVRPLVDGTMAKADVFILADGETRYERRGFTNRNGAIAVDIPVRDTDRYLTLATTDGGDGDNNDWIIFGDACLTLGDR